MGLSPTDVSDHRTPLRYSRSSNWHEYLNLSCSQNHVECGRRACGQLAIAVEFCVLDAANRTRAGVALVAVGHPHLAWCRVDVTVEDHRAGELLGTGVGDDENLAVNQYACEGNDAACSKGVPEVRTIARYFPKVEAAIPQRRLIIAQL